MARHERSLPIISPERRPAFRGLFVFNFNPPNLCLGGEFDL